MSLDAQFAGVPVGSPVLVASGPASHDVNQIGLAQIHGAGGVILKTVCSEKFAHMRYWPRPRYKLIDWDRQIAGRSKNFSLYSYEQGYSGTTEDYRKFIEVSVRHARIPVIGSIFADVAEDWERLALVVEQSGAKAVELDISSPHRPGSLEFKTTFVAAIKAVVHAVHIPVIVKLSPGNDVVHQSVAAEECGAAGVTLCNRLRGLDIDVESRRPILHGYFAGVGGPWAKYYTLRHVVEAAQKITIPISGTGGIMTGEDVLKYVLAGASSVQVLSVIMVNGWESISRMNREIQEYMEKQKISSLEEIRGEAVKKLRSADDIIRWSGESLHGARNFWR